MFNNTLWFLNSILTTKKMLTIVAVLFGFAILNFISLSSTPSLNFTVLDFGIYSLIGYGQGYFSIIEFLRLLILNMFPVYIIGIVLSEDSFKNHMLGIRFKSIRKNFVNMQGAYFLFLSSYVIIYLILTFIVGGIFASTGITADFWEVLAEVAPDSLLNLSPILMIIIGGFLRILELMLLQMIFTVICVFSKSTIVSFLLVGGLHVLLLFDLGSFFPIGVSSIMRLLVLDNDYKTACLKALSLLSGSYLVGFSIIYFKSYKRLFL